MNQPTISIITVCYNASKTIATTLRSVVEQSYPHVEYIVVDGASTDNSLEIIRSYSNKIAKIISEPDKGIYDAMNKGIAQANGEIIGFLNADDCYPHSQVISNIAKNFANPQIDCCYGDLIYFSNDDLSRVVRYWRSSKFILGTFSKGWCPPHPTLFVRKKIYEHFGNFDLQYSMANDIELMMRFFEKHKISSKYIPEVLVKMRLGGVSNRNLKNIIHQNKMILQAAKNHNLSFSIWSFLLYKAINRLSQFILKPKRESDYV